MDSPYANQSSDAYSDNMAIQTENKLIYRKNWNEKHNLVLAALWYTGASESSGYSSTISGVASSGMSDPVTGGTMTYSTSGLNSSISSSDSKSRTARGSLNANYTLLDRYTFSSNVNYEGRSSLGKANRWGFFPSVGFAWHLESEPFMENTKDWMNDCKIRASFGQSGDAPGGLSYMGTYSSLGKVIDNAAIAPKTIELDKLKWQTKNEYDLGLESSFLDNRLSTTLDWYYSLADNLLQTNVSIPTTVGYNGSTIKYYNSGSISNKGLEFRIDYDVLNKGDWKVSTTFNVSRNINKIEKLPNNLASTSFTVSNGNYAQKLVPGTPVGSFFGFKYKGVYQNTEQTYAQDAEGNVMRDYSGKAIVMKNNGITCFPGDAQYEDINHDGNIDGNDVVYLGNCMPIVTGGGGFTVKYKSLSLQTFFHYRLGQKVINAARMNSENMYDADNQSTAVLRRWRNEGDNTDIPRALWKYGYNWLGSDRFVENCSFVRLKTISLSYNLPKKLCRRVHANAMNVFITGYDLFTFTNYNGQDPEVNLPSRITDLATDNSQTPRSRRFSTGLTVNF